MERLVAVYRWFVRPSDSAGTPALGGASRRAFVCAFACAFACALACTFAACGPSRDDWPIERPKIESLTYLQQSPQDPLALEFLVEFVDGDRDLGSGRLYLIVDGDESASIELATLFKSQKPPLALDAEMGEFDVVARIGTIVDEGEEVEIRFRLQDAQGHESNEAAVVLRAIGGGGT